ncbi:VWA domain-containing protein [Salinispira pacifica]|uniref:VWFA domain-containing protein n=1 Tax=Salinispira pacifica TaxID=1307761 RepID=V5WEQ1_9SPIO|nr:vWA domain-containing protein [Salinispira pacifica]AHC13646.1 hypothetical protein L21SP2_0204 [Salinispira pacifica]
MKPAGNRNIILLIILSVFFFPVLYAQDLGISVEDLRIEQSLEGGYYLYVRNKADIESIILTESTEDPEREVASYTLRNPEYHPENGDEKRILDGEILEDDTLHFLLDSTPVPDDQFGSAFRIFIPYVVIYGYDWSRQGEIQVLDGTYLSVRSFELPYADYRGAFQDNPFIIRVSQRPSPGPPEGNYMEETVESFSRIAEDTSGKVLYSQGEEDILTRIEEILSDEEGRQLDLVIALDSTQSMENDMPYLRDHLGDLIERTTTGFDRVRIGFVYYRDYLEEYLYRISDFQTGTDVVGDVLARIRPTGGRDIPEAVNEALYAALENFAWMADNRKIILIGDAPPHPRPRGKITAEMVKEAASENDVAVHVIILPH